VKIGVCTGGGDCPGLNAAIMAIVKSAHKLVHEIIGIRDSLTGLLTDPIKTRVLALEDVDDILTRGGTILGTDNSGNPYKDLKTRDLRVATTKKNFEQLGLDCLIVIGGEGTQGIAAMLSKEGLPIIGIPKTIDNDF
jgi:6-phosphofructokinase 1